MLRSSRWGLVLLAAAIFIGSAAGCSDNKLRTERDQLMKQNQQLQSQLAAAKAQASAAQAQLQQEQTAMQAAASQPAPAAVPPTSTTPGYNSVLPKFSHHGGHAAYPHAVAVRHHHHYRGMTVEHRHGEVARFILSSDVLFASASARLNPRSEHALLHVAYLLRHRYAGRRILVEGYTDDRPIHHPFKNNYLLGLARARSVEAFLVRHGVSRRRMRAISFGSKHPRSRHDLALNRRVEVVVLR